MRLSIRNHYHLQRSYIESYYYCDYYRDYYTLYRQSLVTHLILMRFRDEVRWRHGIISGEWWLNEMVSKNEQTKNSWCNNSWINWIKFSVTPRSSHIFNSHYESDSLWSEIDGYKITFADRAEKIKIPNRKIIYVKSFCHIHPWTWCGDGGGNGCKKKDAFYVSAFCGRKYSFKFPIISR